MNSDKTILVMGLQSVVHIPQLFHLSDENNLKMIVTKIVDDMLVGGSNQNCKKLISRFSSVYKVGTVLHLSGICRFYGTNMCQNEDFVL